MTDGGKTNSREIALDVLYLVLEKGNYSHVVLGQALDKYQYLEKQERAFITRLTEGTLEYLLQIDFVLDACSSVKVRKMKPVIRTILRMSVYQLLHMDRVPDSAVCNEAVKLAAKRRFQGLKGFVNGVLRSVARSKDSIVLSGDSIRYSMPQWIIDQWLETYDSRTVTGMLEAFLADRRLIVRCNRDRMDVETTVESLGAQGVTAERLEDRILCLDQVDYLQDLKAFQQGWIQVQDLSSCLVGRVAEPKPGDYVIDVCAAPGGKSLHVADELHGTGRVEARDLTEEKVALIEETIRRTEFNNIVTRVWDARRVHPDSVEKADIVIADLPCSGLGVIGRKPEIKYRMTLDQIGELAALQREILAASWRYVKPGGKLIYSTCTVSRQENEENAGWFLENFPFEALSLEGKTGEGLTADTLRSGCLQLIPGKHPCDGFFIAAFRRKS